MACCGLKQLFLDFELGFACGSALRDGGGEIVLAIEEIGELEAEIALVGGIGQADFDADDPGANHLLNLVIEVLHPFRLAVAHSVKERFSFGLAALDIFAGAHGGFQDFEGGHAAFAVVARDQTLRDDVAEGLREAVADGVLVGERENADDTLDRFRGVGCVQSGEDQVAGFGGFERDFDAGTRWDLRW